MFSTSSPLVGRAANGRVVGIDASRNRSGGARAHIIGMLAAVDPADFGIRTVHVWSYRSLLNVLPDRPWLVKHGPEELEGSLFRQLWWQRKKFPVELADNGCEVLLTTDAGSLCRFSPAVVMSRDMLSFEPGEISRYWFSLAWVRLILLRYVQVSSLKSAAGALFLTRYAASIIQQFSGPLENVRVIPHGIGANFQFDPPIRSEIRKELKCVYVSNADLYKHQWHVIEAVKMLRDEGKPVSLQLVGAGAGPAAGLVAAALARHDPDGIFATITPAVAHDQIPVFLADADIFIFASSCENMPNTLIEAMACRLPIACSERGPMPEILQDAGVYFNPEDPNSIAAALSRLISAEGRRDEKAVQAKQLAAQFSWTRCASETWRFLADVANQRRVAKNMY